MCVCFFPSGIRCSTQMCVVRDCTSEHAPNNHTMEDPYMLTSTVDVEIKLRFHFRFPFGYPN